jgi:hypothetical protein
LNRNLELAGNLAEKMKRKVARELEWEPERELSNELHLVLEEQAQICQKKIPIGEN